MRYLKCNLPPERHEEILRKFWDYPTQEEEDAVHDLFTPHVFFETYGKRREVWATCCRQHGIIGKHGPKHGSEGSCPFCGQTAVWSAIGKYSERMTSLREETHVAFLRRDGDALLIEAMQIEISYTKDLIYGGIYYDMNCWGQKAYYLAGDGADVGADAGMELRRVDAAILEGEDDGVRAVSTEHDGLGVLSGRLYRDWHGRAE